MGDECGGELDQPPAARLVMANMTCACWGGHAVTGRVWHWGLMIAHAAQGKPITPSGGKEAPGSSNAGEVTSIPPVTVCPSEKEKWCSAVPPLALFPRGP